MYEYAVEVEARNPATGNSMGNAALRVWAKSERAAATLARVNEASNWSMTVLVEVLSVTRL